MTARATTPTAPSGRGARVLSVALDWGPVLDPGTGVGRYTRELGRGLEARGIRVRRYGVSLTGPSDPSVARWRAPAKLVQLGWRRLGAPAISALVGDVQVVHGTNFVLPALGDAPGVVTVHDLSFEREDTFPGGRRLRDLVPWSLRRASAVVVPTKTIAAEVTDRYGLDEALVSVTPEGVSRVFFGATPLAAAALEGMGISGPFVVAVGTIEPRKNLVSLLAAWRRAARELSGWKLVLAGPRGWGPALPQTLGVVALGWVGDDTLPGLLAAADVFCYPSLYEGFGLPPLEAMAAGTPAIAGRYSAAEEVLGDAAFLVEPTDVEALAAALVKVAGDVELRRRLSMAGRARAARFSWERTVNATLGAYEAAVSSR